MSFSAMPISAEPTERVVSSSTGVDIQTFLLPSSLSDQAPSSKLAFIGHPLGRRGGSWQDPTVQAVGRTCAQQGFHVVFINARGRGKSGGWASFSQLPEAEDYQSVVDTYTRERPTRDLLLVGYSAGSLAAAYAQPAVLSSSSPIKCRRILISYPLSALWALTVFRSSPFVERVARLAASTSEQTLAVFGDRDEFTGIDAYRTWQQGLQAQGDGITFEEIKGANHFWFNINDRRKLVDKISDWLRSTSL